MGTVYASCCYQITSPHNLMLPKRKQYQINISQFNTANTIESIKNRKENRENNLQFEDFDIKGRIGSGGFAMVVLGQLKENQEKGIKKQFAIKIMSKATLLKKRLIENIQIEKEIMLHKSRFITSLHLSFQDHNFLYIVMDYAEGGDTHQLTTYHPKKHNFFRSIGEKGLKFIAACVILGLEFLHNHNIIYRDLKPENVLLYKNGYAKLSDFGLSKKIIEQEINLQVLGTTKYMAPQMILGKSYSKEADLWSLGIYLYELSVFKHPFKISEISKKCYTVAVERQEKQMDWKNTELSNDLKDLICSLLKLDPKSRLGSNNFKELKSHKFFQDIDWKALNEQKLQSPLWELVGKHPLDIRSFKERKLSTEEDINMSQDYYLQGWNYRIKQNINILKVSDKN